MSLEYENMEFSLRQGGYVIYHASAVFIPPDDRGMISDKTVFNFICLKLLTREVFFK